MRSTSHLASLLRKSIRPNIKTSRRNTKSSFSQQALMQKNILNNHSGHHQGIQNFYYNTQVIALIFGATAGVIILFHELATGKLFDNAKRAWQEFSPPAVPGDVDMVSLDTQQCLPIPFSISAKLKRGYLSLYPASSSLVISGEAGGGKFDLACQIASIIRTRAIIPCTSILEINGHTPQSMQQGIIAAAQKLGLPKDKLDYASAQHFMRTELFKKHKAIIIVRCLRSETVKALGFPLQDVVNGYCRGWVKPSASVIYTTGQAEVIEQAKALQFYHVSLDHAYSVKDFLAYLTTLPPESTLKKKVANAGVGIVPHLINDLLQNRLPLVRMAIPCLEHSVTTLPDFMQIIEPRPEAKLFQYSLSQLGHPLAKSLLKRISVLPQHGTMISQLAEDLIASSACDRVTAYRKVSYALQLLEKMGLARVLPQDNKVYPLMLVSHAEQLHLDNGRSSQFWQKEMVPVQASLSEQQAGSRLSR